MAVLLPPVLTAILVPFRDDLHLSSVLLLFLLVVIAVAAVGGAGPAILAAISSSLYANWFFFPPIHTWTIRDADNVFALVVFVSVALIVSWFVATVARQSAEAVPSTG